MKIQVISVPYALGKEGSGMGAGPDRVIATGLIDHLRAQGHRVGEHRLQLEDPFRNEVGASFSLNRSLNSAVRSALASGALPMVLTGSCLSAQGILAAARQPVGVIWLDAHADFNTPETTVSGYLDGMALAVTSGRCFHALSHSVSGFEPIPDERLLLVGARALDPLEAELLSKSGVARIRPENFNQLPGALARLRSIVSAAYLHVDLDVLDPSEGRANEYAEKDGLSLSQLISVAEQVSRQFELFAVSFAAYDPSFDGEGRIARVPSKVLDSLLRSTISA
jgi:arginase